MTMKLLSKPLLAIVVIAALMLAGPVMAKDYKSNDSNAGHFQGRSKSQANVVGLEDLLKLPRSSSPEKDKPSTPWQPGF